jgi:hypothetical protein
MPVFPSHVERTNRKNVVQAHLDIKQDYSSKITKAKKRAGGVVQVVEGLPSKPHVQTPVSPKIKIQVILKIY